MKVYVWGSSEKTKILYDQVKASLDELWLVDFVALEQTEDITIKEDLQIKEDPALIIEEESINFKDMIFEWMVPEAEEIKAMFLSIIWNSWGGGCWSKWADWSCWTGCSC